MNTLMIILKITHTQSSNPTTEINEILNDKVNFIILRVVSWMIIIISHKMITYIQERTNSESITCMYIRYDTYIYVNSAFEIIYSQI